MATPGPSSNSPPVPPHAGHVDHQIPLDTLPIAQTPAGQDHVASDMAPPGQPELAPPGGEQPQALLNAVIPDQRDNERQDPVPRPLCQWLTCQLPSLEEFSQSIYNSMIIGLTILAVITVKGRVNDAAQSLAWMTTIWLAGSGITAALTSFVLACPIGR